MNPVDRGQHRGGQHTRGQRSGRAQRDQRTASGLGDAGGQGVTLARAQPEAFEHPGGALEAMTAEPAEQLVCAVAKEKPAHGSAKNEASQFHK
jgi:hypothetical protein